MARRDRTADVSIKKSFILIYSRLEKLRDIIEGGAERGRFYYAADKRVPFRFDRVIQET